MTRCNAASPAFKWCSIFLDKLLVIAGNHYFAAKAHIRDCRISVQLGLNVSARIVVSDKTLWQQVFK